MTPTLKQKAQLYQQLYTGLESGLHLEQILRGELLPRVYAKCSAQLCDDLRAGKTLTRSILGAKLIAPWERRLLAVGEANGELEKILADLAVFFDERSRQLRLLRAKLLYPLLVLIVAIIVQPLPELAAGTLSVGAYITGVIVRLLLVYVAYVLCISLPSERSSGSAANPILLFSMRWIGGTHWLRLQYEVAYLNLLTLCLQSGLDAVASLKLMQESAANRRYRQLHGDAINLIEKKGVSLTFALSTVGLIKHPVVRAFVHSNEVSGTLHSDLRSFVMRMKVETASVAIHHVKQLGLALYLLGFWILLAGYL